MGQESKVFAYVVRSKSPRERGRWLFGDETNAQRFVERQTNGPTKWRRRSPGNWLTQDGDRTWSIKRKEIQDAVALAIHEPATSST